MTYGDELYITCLSVQGVRFRVKVSFKFNPYDQIQSQNSKKPGTSVGNKRGQQTKAAAADQKFFMGEVDLKNFSLGDGSFTEKRQLLKSIVASVLTDDKLLKEHKDIVSGIKKSRH